MIKLSRRSFLTGVGAMPFAIWFERYGQAQTPLVRYDVYSTEGKAMLKVYADAVGKMMNTSLIPQGKPTSWVFQWYTHWIKGDPSGSNKNSIINNIYGASPIPPMSDWKALAALMWETCQAHGTGMDENYFLPWHRMYVYYFERIIRKVSGNPQFTLPYWNYSTSLASQHGIVPPELRMPNDPLFKWLYIEIRNVHTATNTYANVNAGEPIDKYRTNNPLNLSSLKQCDYKPTPPAIPGFCQNIDQTVHGQVHVLVGNSNNMGSVPTAAGDPVFWLHHCNIDRLWASWNKAGRKNPITDTTWMKKQFVFADENGNKVMATVKEFVDIAPLGYTYKKFEPVPAPDPPCPQLSAAAPRRHAIVPGGAVRLGIQPTRATLEPEAGVGAAQASVASRVRALRPGRRLYLVLKNLHADAPPGVLYDVYLDMPPDTPPNRRSPYFVGAIHFFDAVGHGGHATGASDQATPKFFSFDVTQVAKNLLRRRQLSAKPAVSIIPAGQPEAEASPVVGEISLVEH